MCCLSEILGGRKEFLALIHLCFLERGRLGKGDVGMILVLRLTMKENWHSLGESREPETDIKAIYSLDYAKKNILHLA